MLKPIPKSEQLEFKPEFIKRYSQLTDFKEFKKYSLSFLRRSIRVNTLKTTIPEIKKRLKDWKLKPIPWCQQGFWVEREDRRDVGNLIEHHLGYFFVQEAASMIPPIVLQPKSSNESEKGLEKPKGSQSAGETILDLCASPGSKTTQIAQYMKNQGLLIANDYKGLRMVPLNMNIQRLGITNTITTLIPGQYYKDLQFDRILVDAPCSGTGTIRKSLKTLTIWNPNMVKRLCGQQKQLLETGFKMLKPGGTLVYSTCTLEPEEDEGVIDFLIKKYPNAKIDEIKKEELPGLKRSPAVLEFNNKRFSLEIKKCLRIWPQDNDTEGFFVTRIRKI
ncbi:MAG: NOL1/NOP2/sun family putative RNA methylase [Nanoarchaeota archaeon]|nr:NOL1/NOP2/sun family putative RNA methylase [Nanoarchaeota archaeon]